MQAAFDLFEYGRRLEKAGFTPEQVEIQVEGLRAQAAAIQAAFREYEAERRAEAATKGDIARLRGEMREAELRLQKEIRELEIRLEINMNKATMRLLYWQWGGGRGHRGDSGQGFRLAGFLRNSQLS